MSSDQDTRTTPLGRLIRDRRKHLGLGVGTLAVQVGVDQSYISKIELGYVQMPRWDVLNKLADELDLDVTDLLRAAGNRDVEGEADDEKLNTRPLDELPKTPRTGERIKDLRLTQNLTQKDLARKLGVSLQAVSNWESGVTPRTRYLYQLAELLRTTPDDLLGRSRKSIRLDDPALVDLVKELEAVSPEARVALFALIRQAIQVVQTVERNAMVHHTAAEHQSTVSPNREGAERVKRGLWPFEPDVDFAHLDIDSGPRDGGNAEEEVQKQASSEVSPE